MDFYKSFSGTDTLAFILMPGCTPVVIGSLTTISYSMFRNKKPVINIGRTNINGVTRGSRIFAGTMIFTLINQHWIRDLQEQEAVSYLKDFKELKVDELPLFDIMIVSANEYGNVVSMYIYGIDFTDEAQTISVEDLFTENTFSFVARDLSTFERFNRNDNTSRGSSYNSNKYINDSVDKRIYKFASSVTSIDDIARYYKEQTQQHKEDIAKTQPLTLSRDLYLNTSHLMIGNDVAYIQTLLSKTYDDVDINGIFDEQMDSLIKVYQSDIGVKPDGIVNNKLYASIVDSNKPNEQKGKRTGIVVNKNGTMCFGNASLNSNVNYVLKFKDIVEIYELFETDLDGYNQKWYKTEYGYVMAEDIYSAYDEQSISEYPNVKYQDTSVYTKIIQNTLSEIYPDFIATNVFDTNTVDKVKDLQQTHGLYPSGIVDNETWLLLQSLTGTIKQDDGDFVFRYNIAPGTYTIDKTMPLIQQLADYFVDIVCGNTVTTKNSVIAKYPNGNTKTFSLDKTGSNAYRISATDLQKALVYNPTEGSMPSSIDWIVYPLNRTPYKWTFVIV